MSFIDKLKQFFFRSKKKESSDELGDLPPLVKDIIKDKNYDKNSGVISNHSVVSHDVKRGVGSAPGEMPVLSVKKKDSVMSELKKRYSSSGVDASVQKAPPVSNTVPVQNKGGFFSTLAQLLVKDLEELEKTREMEFFDKHDLRIDESNPQKLLNTVLSENIVDDMKLYWLHRKRRDFALRSYTNLESNLFDKLDKLQDVELSWVDKRQDVESALEFISGKETEIKSLVSDFRETLAKIKYGKELTPDKHFYLRNGVVVKDVRSLKDALTFVDDEDFSHHVTSERNDFANWVRFSYHDEVLADLLQKVKSKDGMVKVLSGYQF